MRLFIVVAAASLCLIRGSQHGLIEETEPLLYGLPLTALFRLVYLGGSLKYDFDLTNGWTTWTPRDHRFLTMDNLEFLPDGTERPARIELRQSLAGGVGVPASTPGYFGIPVPWNQPNDYGVLPVIGAVIKLHGRFYENSSEIIEWIRQNVDRCREIFIVVYPGFGMYESDSNELDRLEAEYRKINVLWVEPAGPGGHLPNMNTILQDLLSLMDGPHQLELPALPA